MIPDLQYDQGTYILLRTVLAINMPALCRLGGYLWLRYSQVWAAIALEGLDSDQEIGQVVHA